MLASKLIRFFNFIGTYCILHSSHSNVADATLSGCRCEVQHKPAPESGLNYSCSSSVRVIPLGNVKTILGEEPFYDRSSVYFVDITASTVYRYCIKTGRYYHAIVGDETVSVIIPIEGKPRKFLITYGGYLAILTWDGVSKEASFEKVRQVDPSRPYPEYFLDDAKIACDGALFVYNGPKVLTTNEVIPPRQSTLYSFMYGEQKTQIPDLDFGNGLGFKCDRSRFYFSDSKRKATYEARFNQKTNSIDHIRVLLNYTASGVPGFPDSLTLDADGFVWGTCNAGGKIIKINPFTGRVECSIQLLSTSVTNLAFGKCPDESDPDILECIYATSSSIDTSSAYNGYFFLIKGVGSRGVLPKKLQSRVVFGS